MSLLKFISHVRLFELNENPAIDYVRSYHYKKNTNSISVGLKNNTKWKFLTTKKILCILIVIFTPI